MATEHTQEDEALRAELEDEFEDPVEATADDLRVEAEMPLTGKEEAWEQEMSLRVQEWKHDTSSYPPEVQDAMRNVRMEDVAQPDVALFHAFRQVQKSPSPFFRQKFERLIRSRVKETQGDYNSTGYQLTKILRGLVETE
jgi:hypothetical protein